MRRKWSRIRPRPVVLVTEPGYFQSVMARLRRIGRVLIGTPEPRKLAALLPKADAAVIRVETRLSARLLARARRLKFVASATTGINHIDADAANRGGIRIVHLHGTHTTPTAEHTLALLLSLARKIAPVQEHMKKGGWDRTRWIGKQLAGKTIGIVGIGRIGRTVAKFARALGMNVIAYDPYVRSPRVSQVRMCASLAAMLRKCDIVSIHAALTGETRGMIGPRQFTFFKPGALFINSARGEIVDERALLHALNTGRLAGAAIDVYREEPLPRSSPLRSHARRHANLILTPHLGASTREAVDQAAAEMAGAVEKFFRKA